MHASGAVAECGSRRLGASGVSSPSSQRSGMNVFGLFKKSRITMHDPLQASIVVRGGISYPPILTVPHSCGPLGNAGG